MKHKINFDIDGDLQALREGKDDAGNDGFLTPLIKQLAEAAMKAELEADIEQDDLPNPKNGSSAKTMKPPRVYLNYIPCEIALARSTHRLSRSTKPTSPISWNARSSRYSTSATATKISAITSPTCTI